MDLSQFTRNKEKVRANLVKLPDHSVVCKEGCKIYIPGRFINKGLAGIGDTVWSVAVYTMTTASGFYATSLIPCVLAFQPTDIREQKWEGNAYYEFSFEPGATVIESTVVGQLQSLVSLLFSEFVINGNVSFGFNLLDLIKLFNFAEKYCNFTVGANPQIFEAIINIISRDRQNLNQLWRYTAKTLDDITLNPPTIIGLRNAAKTSTNTTAKLVGSYFSDGKVSALINPSDRVEGVEEILRK